MSIPVFLKPNKEPKLLNGSFVGQEFEFYLVHPSYADVAAMGDKADNVLARTVAAYIRFDADTPLTYDEVCELEPLVVTQLFNRINEEIEQVKP